MQNNTRKIDDIILENGYTKEYLKDCELKGICNGMGMKGGFEFTNFVRNLKFFDSEKELKLLEDLDLVSDIHDLAFEAGGTYLDFLKANYIFSRDLVRLLNWTNFYGKLTVFIMAFLGTTIFGKKAFNFKKDGNK